MAEIPEVYFSEAPRLENVQREEFSNFGRYGGVHISGPEKADMVFQYNHRGQEHNLSLSAIAPTLPLSDTPAKVVSLSGDRVMERLQHLNTVGKALLKKLSRGKGLASTQRCCLLGNSVWEFRQWLEHHYEEELPKGDKYPDWFSRLEELVQQLPPSGYVPKVNTKYYGGCVSAFRTLAGLGIVHASGLSLDNLSVVGVTGSPEWEGGTRLLREGSVTSLDVGFPVCQIHTQAVRQNVTCCVRTEASCNMYSVTQGNHSLAWQASLLDTQSVKGEVITSVSVSPFIPGEALLVTDVGSMYVWNAGKSLQQVVELEAPRFRCLETWRHCHYGAHPRQVVLTDQTSVQLFDSRSPKQGGGLDILALPDSRLKQYERISASAHVAAWPFCHLVSTDYWLFLMDQRFPKSPVLKWSHMLGQPPQYLWAGDYLPGHTLALVGCQQHPEVTAFHFHHQGASPVTSDLQPWRLSPFSDFGHLCRGDNGDSLLLQRRLQTSLAGMAACTGLEDGTLATFQMDSFGEVYHQVYGPMTSDTRDKTGLKADCALWKERAEQWLQSMEQQLTSLHSQHLSKLREYSDLPDWPAVAELPPGQCLLCRGRLEETTMDLTFDVVEALTGPGRLSDVQGWEEELSTCHACQQKAPRRPPQLSQWELPTLAEEVEADTEQQGARADPGLRLQQLEEGEADLQEQLMSVDDYLTSPAAQEDLNSQTIYLQYLEDQRFQQILPLRAERLGQQKREYIEAVWREHADKMAREEGDGLEDHSFFPERLPDGLAQDAKVGRDANVERETEAERSASLEGDSDAETRQSSDTDAERQRDGDLDSRGGRSSKHSVDMELLAEKLLEYEISSSQRPGDKNGYESSASLF